MVFGVGRRSQRNSHYAHGTAAPRSVKLCTEIHAYRDRGGQSHYAPAEISHRSPRNSRNSSRARAAADAVLRSSARARAERFRWDGGRRAHAPDVSGHLRAADVFERRRADDRAGRTRRLHQERYRGPTRRSWSSRSSITNVLLDGFDGTPGTNAAEVTMDIELVAAVAPGAKIVVYKGPNSVQTLLSRFTRIASDHQASQISVSWGVPEPQLSIFSGS